jgi:hypothetical protein
MLLQPDLLLLGRKTEVVAMVVVQILIMEVLATMPPLLPTRLRGLSKLRLTQLPLHTQDTQLLVTPAVISLKELHLVLPLPLALRVLDSVPSYNNLPAALHPHLQLLQFLLRPLAMRLRHLLLLTNLLPRHLETRPLLDPDYSP